MYEKGHTLAVTSRLSAKAQNKDDRRYPALFLSFTLMSSDRPTSIKGDTRRSLCLDSWLHFQVSKIQPYYDEKTSTCLALNFHIEKLSNEFLLLRAAMEFQWSWLGLLEKREISVYLRPPPKKKKNNCQDRTNKTNVKRYFWMNKWMGHLKHNNAIKN